MSSDIRCSNPVWVPEGTKQRTVMPARLPRCVERVGDESPGLFRGVRNLGFGSFSECEKLKTQFAARPLALCAGEGVQGLEGAQYPGSRV